MTSFLHDDQVLVKLLADTGLLDKLTKHAQKVNTEAQLIATKLANMLATQAVQSGPKNEPSVYVRDLVDMVAYLNFLMKTDQRADDGKPIVIHQTFGGEPSKEFLDSIDKSLYSQYGKDFWVHRDGLTNRMRELDIASNQAGKEVMKPLVKHLISQLTDAGIEFTSLSDQEIPSEMPESADGKGGKKVKHRVPFAVTDPDWVDEDAESDPHYKNVNMKGKKQKPKTMEEEFASMRNVLPFLSNQTISPYDMDLFARNIYLLVSKHKDKLLGPGAGPLLGQVTQYVADMDKNYASWQQFVRTVASQNPRGNALQALEEVPYDRNGYPRTVLEQIFGNTPNAREASQWLLLMINLSQQILLSLQRSPQIVNLLGKDVIDSQIRQARSLNESLNPLARV